MSQRPRRVVLMIANLHARDGGPPNAVANLARCLAEDGRSVTIVCQRDPQEIRVQSAEAALACGVRIIEVPETRFRRTRFSFEYLQAAVAASSNADVISYHGFYQYVAVAAYFASVRNRVPLMLQPHGIFEPYQEAKSSGRKRAFQAAVGRLILRGTSAVIAASPSEAEGVAATHPSLRTVTHVIPLGVDVPEGSASPGANVPQLLYASRVAPKKRLDLLIEAIRILDSQGIPVSLDICGDGDSALVASLKERSRDLPISWRGHLNREELGVARRSAALFCLTSENENFAQAVTEAMATGLPILTTSAVAASSHVLSAGAGWVLDQPTVAEIANAIADAVSDSTRLHEMGTRGRAYCAERLSWPLFARTWAEVAAGLAAPKP